MPLSAASSQVDRMPPAVLLQFRYCTTDPVMNRHSLPIIINGFCPGIFPAPLMVAAQHAFSETRVSYPAFLCHM
jgi:hypothetical protein